MIFKITLDGLSPDHLLASGHYLWDKAIFIWLSRESVSWKMFIPYRPGITARKPLKLDTILHNNWRGGVLIQKRVPMPKRVLIRRRVNGSSYQGHCSYENRCSEGTESSQWIRSSVSVPFYFVLCLDKHQNVNNKSGPTNCQQRFGIFLRLGILQPTNGCSTNVSLVLLAESQLTS